MDFLSLMFLHLVSDSGIKKNGKMKRKRFTEEKIMAVLREREAGGEDGLAGKHG